MTPRAYPQHVTRWMTSYLTSTLAPALGIPPVFDEISAPAYGLKSYLLLVHPRGADSFVLRCEDDPARAEDAVLACELAAARDLPAPRVRHHDVTRRHFREHGFGVVVENFVRGEHLTAGRVGDARLRDLGAALARLHAVENSRWGRIRRPHSRSVFDWFVLPRVSDRLRTLAANDPDFRHEWREGILEWTKSRRRRWRGGPPFALTHGNVNTGNVVFAADGARFLGYKSMRFGCPERDLVAGFDFFCADESEEAILRESYLAAAPAERRESLEASEPLFRVWHHLARWATQASAWNAARERGDAASDELRRLVRREREVVWKWLDT